MDRWSFMRFASSSSTSLPEPNERVSESGTRIVSYQHDMGEWRPERTQTVIVEEEEETIYLWMANDEARRRLAR